MHEKKKKKNLKRGNEKKKEEEKSAGEKGEEMRPFATRFHSFHSLSLSLFYSLLFFCWFLFFYFFFFSKGIICACVR
jgi:hypothetical protein